MEKGRFGLMPEGTHNVLVKGSLIMTSECIVGVSAFKTLYVTSKRSIVAKSEPYVMVVLYEGENKNEGRIMIQRIYGELNELLGKQEAYGYYDCCPSYGMCSSITVTANKDKCWVYSCLNNMNDN